MRIRSIPSALLATLTAAVALLPLLGRKPLTDWDEAIYAEVSREMLGHSWLVPHWDAALWLEKPPLMLWVTAAFFHLFGVTEFWARAASALSGVAIVGLLHWWLARTRGTPAAWLSTLMLLGTFGFLHACHTGEMDVMLSLGCVVALIGLAQVEADCDSGWLLFWTGFALAAMTKGAASVTLPITAAILVAMERRRLRGTFFVGLALCFAIALPWHLAMIHLYGRDFVHEYLGLHVLTRATEQIEGHVTPWWFYLKVLLVAAPPFVLLYPAAVWSALRRGSGLRAFGIFALVELIFFSVGADAAAAVYCADVSGACRGDSGVAGPPDAGGGWGSAEWKACRRGCGRCGVCLADCAGTQVAALGERDWLAGVRQQRFNRTAAESCAADGRSAAGMA